MRPLLIRPRRDQRGDAVDIPTVEIGDQSIEIQWTYGLVSDDEAVPAAQVLTEIERAAQQAASDDDRIAARIETDFDDVVD